MISAALLLGPTGVGKTPLGQQLEDTGLWGRRCHHFDFGQSLRQLHQSTNPPVGFDSDDLAIVSRVVEAGALLEDEHFSVALKIFRCFVSSSKVLDQDLVLLNGLPRHLGQAMGLTEIIDVRAVVLLSCSPEVVFERIRIDTGGDRKGREDDRSEAIRHRIEVFEERTRPLLDYYAAQGVPIETFNVGPETTAAEIQSQIEQRDMCAATGNS